ncbi:MAG: hypothetical protein Tsb0016_08270 [Sphingomonadales bacterium]
MSMNRNQNPSPPDRLSLRKSVLIWIAGAMLGWVFAFVGIYSFLRFTDHSGGSHGQPSLATDYDARSLSEIEPAAGPATTPKPQQDDQEEEAQ